MKYKKPECNVLGLAALAIQGSMDKSLLLAPEVLNGPAVATQFAYEADE